LSKLLLDIGATSIKSVFQKDDALIKGSIKRTDSFSTKYGNKFSSDVIIGEFLSHVEEQYRICPFSEIWLCTEMHNFTTLDQRKGVFSEFYSWRHVSKRTLEIREKINQEYPDFIHSTGQSLHAGMPVLNFSELIGSDNSYRMLTLSELIICKLGTLSGKIDSSMAASYGCYSPLKEEWEIDVLDKIYPDLKFEFPSVFKSNEDPLLGVIKLGGKDVQVFGGYGDMQTALLGSSLDDKSISINLGTGSQVAKVYKDITNLNGSFDLKPFFGKFLLALTHIPAGRSLEYLNTTIFKDNNFWRKLNNITPQSLDRFNELIEFDLNIFPNNWRYNENSLDLIKKSNLSLDDMYVALVKVFCDQYIELINLFTVQGVEENIIISGGRLKEIPTVQNIFSKNFKVVRYPETNGVDETLLGLNILSIEHKNVI
jgi:sugar (pentulose or hexulose) kinase